MKKLINAVDNVLSESLDGFAAAHADIVELGADRLFVRRKQAKKVGNPGSDTRAALRAQQRRP